MIKGIIIDDEQNARESLRFLVDKYCDNIEILGEANDVKSGLECIIKYEPDLVFLDIEMPDGDGFDLLRKVHDFSFDIIFTTAYSEFAVQAFKYNTIDYLLKPIVHEELIKAVDKAELELETKDLTNKFNKLLSYVNNGGPQKRLVLTAKNKYAVVYISDIVMCRSDRNNTIFYIKDGEVIPVSKTLKDFSDKLEESGFLKTHRQYMVNLNHIKSLSRLNSNIITLTLDLEAPVSARRKDRLIKYINEI